MKKLTLNLLHPDRSDIGYRMMTFNDGEPHIWIDEFDRKSYVSVLCRVSNPADLFILMQVGDVLRRQGVEFTLKITYLMSMRMDRVISFGEAFSLKLVTDIINGLGADKVAVLEPHSGRTDREIHNMVPVCGINHSPGIVHDNDIIVHPDAGAAERYEHDDHLKIIASKKRDLTNGKIIALDLEDGADEIVHEHPDRPFLVVDDLCDGGGTFAWLAQVLKDRYPDRQRRIFVTHMVNVRGIGVLADNYDQVIFTNSFRDWKAEMGQLPDNVRQIDVDKDWRIQ